METSEVVLVFLGIKWTLPLIGSAVVGFATFAGACYKIYERWTTREARHLSLLHEYLDKEEKEISSRRREVLTSIGLSHHSYLTDQKLDVGDEIDDAVKLLDRGRPDRAEARLKELLKKIQNNANILERRINDLKKHERSVNIFLAAIADNSGNIDSGLSYISDALLSDNRDLDALRFKGLLLMQKGELSLAEQTFDKLRINSTGSASNRAEAYFGLACSAVKRGTASYPDAERALANALANLNGLAPNDQSPLIKIGVHQMLGDIYATEGWDQHNRQLAIDSFSNR
jgi:predicted Zn-dependent protease